MKATDRAGSGFTLVEMLVVVSLMSVILAAAWTVMLSVSVMSNQLSAGAVAADESQVFVNRIANELLEAGSLKSLAGTSTSNADAQGAFYDIRPRQIGFYADVDHDGRPERVAYYVSGAGILRQQASAANATYPYSWATSSTAETVVRTIDPHWNGAVFTYYAAGSWPPEEITSASQVGSITAVEVRMQNAATWADQTVSHSATTTVRVRTIGNGF